MFETTMTAAIAAARTLAGMDDLSRAIWQAHASGALDDAGAQALAEQLHVRRAGIREAIAPVGIPAGRASLFPKRRHPVSPDRIASRDRRRLLAASGPMPPQLAARFTTGQLAVLRIVAAEVIEKGVCGLCIDAIAARAGVCRRLAQTAIRLAEGDGLLTIQERRHEGRKSDPNLIRIINREWLAWTRRGGRARATGGWMQNDTSHGQEGSEKRRAEANRTVEMLPRGSGRPERISTTVLRGSSAVIGALHRFVSES